MKLVIVLELTMTGSLSISLLTLNSTSTQDITTATACRTPHTPPSWRTPAAVLNQSAIESSTSATQTFRTRESQQGTSRTTTPEPSRRTGKEQATMGVTVMMGILTRKGTWRTSAASPPGPPGPPGPPVAVFPGLTGGGLVPVSQYLATLTLCQSCGASRDGAEQGAVLIFFRRQFIRLTAHNMMN